MIDYAFRFLGYVLLFILFGIAEMPACVSAKTFFLKENVHNTCGKLFGATSFLLSLSVMAYYYYSLY